MTKRWAEVVGAGVLYVLGAYLVYLSGITGNRHLWPVVVSSFVTGLVIGYVWVRPRSVPAETERP